MGETLVFEVGGNMGENMGDEWVKFSPVFFKQRGEHFTQFSPTFFFCFRPVFAPRIRTKTRDSKMGACCTAQRGQAPWSLTCPFTSAVSTSDHGHGKRRI